MEIKSNGEIITELEFIKRYELERFVKSVLPDVINGKITTRNDIIEYFKTNIKAKVW